MLRALADRLAPLVASSSPRLRPCLADLGKAAVAGATFSAAHLLAVAAGYFLWGLGEIDPEAITRALLLGLSWLVLHFAALTATAGGPPGS